MHDSLVGPACAEFCFGLIAHPDSTYWCMLRNRRASSAVVAANTRGLSPDSHTTSWSGITSAYASWSAHRGSQKLQWVAEICAELRLATKTAHDPMHYMQLSRCRAPQLHCLCKCTPVAPCSALSRGALQSVQRLDQLDRFRDGWNAAKETNRSPECGESRPGGRKTGSAARWLLTSKRHILVVAGLAVAAAAESSRFQSRGACWFCECCSTQMRSVRAAKRREHNELQRHCYVIG